MRRPFWEPEAAEQVANSTQTAIIIELGTLPSTPACDEKSVEDCCSLQGAENVVYEARNDSTGISFVENGKKEWVPVVITKRGRKTSAHELKGCKRDED